MGSNSTASGCTLLTTEAPVVGTGMEEDSDWLGVCVVAKKNGTSVFESKRIVVHPTMMVQG